MKRFIYSLSFVALLSTFAAAQEASLSVSNEGNVPVILNWVDFNGQEQTYQTIPPKQRVDQQTYVGHKWRIRVAQTNEYLSEITMTSIAHGAAVAKMVNNRPVNPIVNPVNSVNPINPINPINPQASLPALNAAILRHAQSQTGQYVGPNRQCTDLVMYALRMAGARSMPGGQFPSYTWGQQLSHVSQLMPGDIVQLSNCYFEKITPFGSSFQNAMGHTAVVTSVNGTRIQVLEQNVSGSPAQAGEYDMSTLKTGTVTFFRPQAETTAMGRNGNRTGGRNFTQQGRPSDAELIGNLVNNFLQLVN